MCQLCYSCLKEDQREFIKAAFLEHSRRGAYRRVYPPPMVSVILSRVIFPVHCPFCRVWAKTKLSATCSVITDVFSSERKRG